MERGDLAKLGIILCLVLFLIFLSTQIYTYRAKTKEARAAYQAVEAKLQGVLSDNINLKSDLDYFGFPENLEKEIRGRFNYHLPGERTIILVPQNGTSTQ